MEEDPIIKRYSKELAYALLRNHIGVALSYGFDFTYFIGEEERAPRIVNNGDPIKDEYWSYKLGRYKLEFSLTRYINSEEYEFGWDLTPDFSNENISWEERLILDMKHYECSDTDTIEEFERVLKALLPEFKPATH